MALQMEEESADDEEEMTETQEPSADERDADADNADPVRPVVSRLICGRQY